MFFATSPQQATTDQVNAELAPVTTTEGVDEELSSLESDIDGLDDSELADDTLSDSTLSE